MKEKETNETVSQNTPEQPISADPSKTKPDVDMNKEAEKKAAKHFTSIVNSSFKESEEDDEYTEPAAHDEPITPVPPTPEPESITEDADLDFEGMSRFELTQKLDSFKKMLNDGLITAEEFETYKIEILRLL